MARELSGAARAEAKFKEKENERQRRRDDVDERVLAALAKAELEANAVMDDLNEIASAADHEELARFGEVARERERMAAAAIERRRRKTRLDRGTYTEGHRFEPRARRRAVFYPSPPPRRRPNGRRAAETR